MDRIQGELPPATAGTSAAGTTSTKVVAACVGRETNAGAAANGAARYSEPAKNAGAAADADARLQRRL